MLWGLLGLLSGVQDRLNIHANKTGLKSMAMRLAKLSLLLFTAFSLSACMATLDIGGGYYYDRPVVYTPPPAPEPYYAVIYETVRYGCCNHTVQREVLVFYHTGYQAWGYWGTRGEFIFY